MRYPPELDPGECRHGVWFQGHKIPRSNGMPERAWGAYLPGDEPHWRCGHKWRRDDPCPLEWSLECPLIQETLCLCPFCLENEEHTQTWGMDEDCDTRMYCPGCGASWAYFMNYLEDVVCAVQGDE